MGPQLCCLARAVLGAAIAMGIQVLCLHRAVLGAEWPLEEEKTRHRRGRAEAAAFKSDLPIQRLANAPDYFQIMSELQEMAIHRY